MPQSDESLVVTIHRPTADRVRAGWIMRQQTGRSERIADYRRLFAFYYDLVEQEDFALKKDPRAHDRMMRDGQIFSATRIRQLATASRGVSIAPTKTTGDARKYSDLISDMFDKIERMPEVLLNMLDSIPRGLSVQEIEWELGDDLIFRPRRLYPVHPSRVAFDLRNNLVLRSPIDIFWGEKLPPFTFVTHTFDPEPGDWQVPQEESRIVFGHGLLDRAYPWWLWKSILMRMRLRNLERTASGALVGRYPWKNQEALGKLMEAMNAFDTNSKLAWPSDAGFEIDLLKQDTTPSEAFEKIIRYIDEQLSKMFLGSTLLLDVGSIGSYAMSEVHERTTFGRVVAHDAQSLISTIKLQLIGFIFAMNNWPPEMMPEPHLKSGPRWSLTEVVNAMDKLIAMGFPVSWKVISEETGIREPGPGESVLKLKPLAGEIEIESGPGGPLVKAKIETPQDIPEVVQASLADGRVVRWFRGNGDGPEPPQNSRIGGATALDVVRDPPGSPESARIPGNAPGDPKPVPGWRVVQFRQLPLTDAEHVDDGIAGRFGQLFRVELPPDDEPAASLIYAGANLYPVKFRYTKADMSQQEYIVEPYSFRKTRDGTVLFFAHDIHESKTKSFRLGSIENVQPLTRMRFTPRWKVELVEEREREKVHG